MKELAAIIFLVLGLSLTAYADIWKWVDEQGNVHYGDRPAPEYALKAELVNYAAGKRSAGTSGDSRTATSRGKDIDPDETGDEARARENAQAYYCEQARDIYRSYVDAPRLYRTGEDGQRQYLSDEEAAAALANARASVDEWCK
jgi:hypothetical protein